MTGGEVATFDLPSVLFCARGRMETPEKDCFALTYTQIQGPSTPKPAPAVAEAPDADADESATGQQSTSEQLQTATFQLHAFRCLVPEAVRGPWVLVTGPGGSAKAMIG